MPAKVVIIMGSASDRAHAENIAAKLSGWGVTVEMRVASAHKSARHLLDMLVEYEAQPGPRVYIAIAGRSNALAGLVDANVSAPVITCPPYSDSFAGADIYSSLRMPGGIAPMLVLEPENAALAAAKILGLGDASLRQAISEYQQANERRIREDDRKLQSS
jgi:5-(carboxyamino)imidazole ribonucleotide mutase/phosphoribosylaminoimidazole-succinocarboxamide synthase